MLVVIDVFCGAGGASLGMHQAGLTLCLGVDIDPWACRTYRQNFVDVPVLKCDVRTLTSPQLREFVPSGAEVMLVGCPPCRKFSKLRAGRETDPGPEFDAYLRLLWSLRPKFIFFENVPRIVKWKSLWGKLLGRLNRLGYVVWTQVVDASDFGVPQKRRRLLLLGSRRALDVEVPPRPHSAMTVRMAIGHLPAYDAGIPNHKSRQLSRRNQMRLESTPKDGGMSKRPGESFVDSYARMWWDFPAPTLTTKCISYSNGRFGHPAYDRGITVREAAILQGFPEDYLFCGPIESQQAQVGNAVPPPIAKWFGTIIRKDYAESKSTCS